MTLFFTALAFLTRIPIRRGTPTPEAIGRSAFLFPLVGAVLGVMSAILVWLLHRVVPSMLAATLVVVLGVVVTGALHFDGLADMADGFGGGQTRDDVLRIMRDHQIGTYGALALIGAVLLQVLAIATLIDRGLAASALVVAPTASRWTMVMLGQRLPYARAEPGLGRTITNHVSRASVFTATALAVVIALAVEGAVGLLNLGAAVVVTVLVGFACRRRIGGVTGDTLGANAVLCETTVLVLAVMLS